MHISPDDKRLQYCGRIDFDIQKHLYLSMRQVLYRFVLPGRRSL